MANITQDMLFRLSLIKYAKKFGVTKAAIKNHTNCQYIYRWLKRYDGSIPSLVCRSRKPHHHPDQHTDEEISLIKNMYRRNQNAGLDVLRVKLRQRGYCRSVTGLWRAFRKLQLNPESFQTQRKKRNLMNKCFIRGREFR